MKKKASIIFVSKKGGSRMEIWVRIEVEKVVF
jgi:hypothetical protein